MTIHIIERPLLTESVVSHEPLLDRIYRARGITSAEEIDYNIKNLPSFTQLKDAPKAANILADAIENNQNILIVGDFDTDGATSTALAVRALKSMGASHVHYCVPNRFQYGYGLSPAILDTMNDQHIDVLVTVDNGISSTAGVKYAHTKGMKVVITDHHQPPTELPDAEAIINPKQHDCLFPSENLAGVGVIFYVMIALRDALRQRDWFHRCQIEEPRMTQFLDLVAVGTVADMVPLDYLNRTLVHFGLKRIRHGAACPGIYALLASGNRDYKRCQASDLSFTVGPRLNAAGRLEDMSKGIACLLSDCPQQADLLTHCLTQLNGERRGIEEQMQAEADHYISQLSQNDVNQPAICLLDSNWHQGVIGLLASRLKNRHHRPVVVFTETEGGYLKGSARSIAGLHIHDVLTSIASDQPDLLSNFGGHAMAAGLTLHKDHYTNFRHAWQSTIANMCPPEALEPKTMTDGELPIDRFNLKTFDLLYRHSGPWGQNFDEPCFHGDFTIIEQRIVGQKHLKLVLSPVDYDEIHLQAIVFNVDTTNWPNHHCNVVRLVYTLSLNDFRGHHSLQLIAREIDDVTTQCANTLQPSMDTVSHEII